MKLANLLFSTHAKIDVLRTIYFAGDGIYGRKISLLGEINPRSCQLALQELEALNIIYKNGNRRKHSFFLNREHPLYRELLEPIFEGERRLYREVSSKIKEGLSPQQNDSLVSIWSFVGKEKEGKTIGIILLFGMDISPRDLASVEKKAAQETRQLLKTPVKVKAFTLKDIKEDAGFRDFVKGAIIRVLFGERPEDIARDLGITRGPLHYFLSKSLYVS